MAYIRGLKDSGRDCEIPRWLIVSDFARIAVHDLEPEQDPDAPLFNRLPPSVEFPLADLHRYIRHFAFIAGYTHHKLNAEDPANLEATQLMCNLHDALEAGGCTGHELKRFLVRILFCLFAEDNGIFPRKAFELFLRDRTAADGSDLGVRLEQLFRVLNTDMRNRLLAYCGFYWETISPAVFGSLFQAVIDSKERRQIGAHYTAEKNILKLIRSLFLDELYGIEIEEFPARIAEVALWLTNHQANVALSQEFGQFYQRMPLRSSPSLRPTASCLRPRARIRADPRRSVSSEDLPASIGVHLRLHFTVRQKHGLSPLRNVLLPHPCPVPFMNRERSRGARPSSPDGGHNTGSWKE